MVKETSKGTVLAETSLQRYPTHERVALAQNMQIIPMETELRCLGCEIPQPREAPFLLAWGAQPRSPDGLAP